MELMWMVYSISVLASLATVAILVFVLGIGISLMVLLASHMDGFPFPGPKKVIAALVTSLVVIIIVPSEKTMYLMAGAYATQKVAEAPATKELADKIFVIINDKLNSMVKK